VFDAEHSPHQLTSRIPSRLSGRNIARGERATAKQAIGLGVALGAHDWPPGVRRLDATFTYAIGAHVFFRILMSGCAKTFQAFDGTGDTSFRPQRISSEKKRELKKFVEVGAKQLEPALSVVLSQRIILLHGIDLIG